MLRTHTCGELRPHDIDTEATLCGWVDSYRDHGGGLFVDLRDRYGITQVVFNPPTTPPAVIEASKALRSEYVIQVRRGCQAPTGRPVEPRLATGEIEVDATEFELLNKSLTPPVAPSESVTELPGEDLRLKHRYLDLRRPAMQRMMLLRDRIIKRMRDYFAEHDFIDVETPDARPQHAGRGSRLPGSQPGSSGGFYALPQSPQLYKQILMVAGYDRYVQVARCFRDEDLRADRQPEFTQLDMEMSFVDADDVMGMIDGLVARLAQELLGIEVSLPLPRMTYDEAMERFGHDAPDLRFGMEMIDCTDLAAESEFRVFTSRGRVGRPGPGDQRQEGHAAFILAGASTS